MPGGPDREIALASRRFSGTMLAADPAFVPGNLLVQCNNWVPDLTFVLTKRHGSRQWQTLPGAGRCDPLVYTTGSDGHRYLYAVAGDTLYVSIDDGAFAAVTNGAFATTGSLRYGVAAIGDTLYAGNDSDPVKQVPLGQTAIDLVQLGLATDTGQAVAWADDPNSTVIQGAYAYRWGIFNTVTGRWTKLGPVQATQSGGTSRQRMTFTAPSGGLATNEQWHLFLAGVDQMIEGAHDQTPNGLAVGTTFSVLDDPRIDTTAVPIPSTVTRHASRLVAHRGCLWGAGGTGSTAHRAWQTSVLVPGMEQTTFNEGLFFPATALTPDLGDPVTALTPALATSGTNPQAPLALFTATRTWLLFGDLVDDPNSTLVQISGIVGCPSERTIAATRLGLIFAGKHSVYYLPGDKSEPQDIGWPIEPALRAVPVALRTRCWAIYHRGFYKLALVPAGGSEATQQWWLDLRRGLGDPPSWWGPHTTPPYTAGAFAPNNPTEDDRAWAVMGTPAQVLLVDQADSYVEDGVPPVPIVSSWTTGFLDGGAPLTPKLAKRARIIARADASTTLGIAVNGDEATSASTTLRLPVSTGGVWNTSDWEVSSWTVLALTLVEFECPVPEIRARAFQTTVTHADAVRCDLRDFELRVQPSFRETM